jgi:hypothetical protein
LELKTGSDPNPTRDSAIEKKEKKRHNRYRHTFFRDREIIKGREKRDDAKTQIKREAIDHGQSKPVLSFPPEKYMLRPMQERQSRAKGVIEKGEEKEGSGKKR